MRLCILLAVTSLFASCQATQAERPQSTARTAENRYIDALVAAPDLRVVYASDGAADATVMEKPVPAVRSILGLGSEAIPLLIEHLDDSRPTTASFVGGGGRKPVAV